MKIRLMGSPDLVRGWSALLEEQFGVYAASATPWSVVSIPSVGVEMKFATTLTCTTAPQPR